VHIAHKQALLKSGIVGVKVSIMPPETILPDKITFIEESAPATAEQKVEEKKPKGHVYRPDEYKSMNKGSAEELLNKQTDEIFGDEQYY